MKIAIVGGGTAGWLAALIISKAFPTYKIQVIESSKIGIIGAGEGSTSMLTALLNNTFLDLGTNLLEFIAQTGATLKYGIMHKNWTSKKDFQYFGPLGGTPTSNEIRDWFLLFQTAYNHEKLHLTSLEGIYVENNLTDFNGVDFATSPEGEVQFSFHFDAHKVGKYFKSKCQFVESIDAVVKSVSLNENGFIDKLLLDNQKTIDADFYIDASGFSKVLINSLDNTWESYSAHLPVNCAMPFLLPSEEKMKPYTTAWAQKYGWMWQIPTLDRRGCGYVFCDDFTTPEKAQIEIETVLGHAIDPIKVLKFDTGKLKYNWQKNCLAIGLASAFAEPLEATSIHSTILQILQFVYNGISGHKEKYVHNQSITDNYNRYTTQLFENYRDFLNIHYMGGRTDSEFWQYMSTPEAQTDQTKTLLEISKHRVPNVKDFFPGDGFAGYDIWAFVMANIGIITPELCVKEFETYRSPINQKHIELFSNNIVRTRKQNLDYDKFIYIMKEKYNANTVYS